MTARLMLSCGEPSGDLYAGALTRELRALDPGLTISGLGGPQFAAAGGQLLADYRGLTVTGLTEALGKLPHSYATIRRLVETARRAKPDAFVAIDFPDFNFRLARRLKALGIPVIYYVSPQIWAWRPRRIETMRAFADLVIVIFPFEEAIYRDAGLPVTFVGHPLLDLVAPSDPADFVRRHGLVAGAPTIAVLPGSRPNEVGRILPELLGAAARIRERVPDAQFVVARAPNLDDRIFEVARRGAVQPLAIAEGETDAVLAAADVALTASGTATVQAAIHDTPMVVVYRVSPLTYRLGRRLLLVDTFAMVNLIAGERIVPELIQDACTPEGVAREAIELLTDGTRRARVREGLALVRQRLGGPGASRRAAEAVLRTVSGIRDQGSGTRDQGSGTRDQGSGIREQGSGKREQGSGKREQGSGKREQGSGNGAAMKEKIVKRLLVCLVCVLLAARPGATVLVPADVGELARDAGAIVRGQVVAVDARWTPDRRSIETLVTLEVEASLKGSLGQTVQFLVPGGTLGRYRNLVVGAPEFDPGQRVVVFLGWNGPSIPFLVGLSQGVFRVRPNAAGTDWVVRQTALSEFEQRVRALARGQQ